MKLFLNDAESPFGRCFMEMAHSDGHSVIAARQQGSDDTKQYPKLDPKQSSPQILNWNLASVFSIRLVLRQCHFFWNEEPADYIFILHSNMLSVSLFRDELHDIHQKIEEQFYGPMMLLRELEDFRSKSLQQRKFIFVILEGNPAIELLGGSIYSALRHSFHHILSTRNDPNIYGFQTQSNNYEAYSKFILNQIERRPEKSIGKWQNFKPSLLPRTRK